MSGEAGVKISGNVPGNVLSYGKKFERSVPHLLVRLDDHCQNVNGRWGEEHKAQSILFSLYNRGIADDKVALVNKLISHLIKAAKYADNSSSTAAEGAAGAADEEKAGGDGDVENGQTLSDNRPFGVFANKEELRDFLQEAIDLAESLINENRVMARDKNVAPGETGEILYFSKRYLENLKRSLDGVIYKEAADKNLRPIYPTLATINAAADTPADAPAAAAEFSILTYLRDVFSASKLCSFFSESLIRLLLLPGIFILWFLFYYSLDHNLLFFHHLVSLPIKSGVDPGAATIMCTIAMIVYLFALYKNPQQTLILTFMTACLLADKIVKVLHIGWAVHLLTIGNFSSLANMLLTVSSFTLALLIGISVFRICNAAVDYARNSLCSSAVEDASTPPAKKTASQKIAAHPYAPHDAFDKDEAISTLVYYCKLFFNFFGEYGEENRTAGFLFLVLYVLLSLDIFNIITLPGFLHKLDVYLTHGLGNVHLQSIIFVKCGIVFLLGTVFLLGHDTFVRPFRGWASQSIKGFCENPLDIIATSGVVFFIVFFVIAHIKFVVLEAGTLLFFSALFWSLKPLLVTFDAIVDDDGLVKRFVRNTLGSFVDYLYHSVINLYYYFRGQSGKIKWPCHNSQREQGGGLHLFVWLPMLLKQVIRGSYLALKFVCKNVIWQLMRVFILGFCEFVYDMFASHLGRYTILLACVAMAVYVFGIVGLQAINPDTVLAIIAVSLVFVTLIVKAMAVSNSATDAAPKLAAAEPATAEPDAPKPATAANNNDLHQQSIKAYSQADYILSCYFERPIKECIVEPVEIGLENFVNEHAATMNSYLIGGGAPSGG